MTLFKKILKLFHRPVELPVYICTHLDTRNRYKNEKYKIPFDKPQCPVFKDNRCCGSCSKSHTCDHIVNCNCFGFAHASMGGNEKRAYLTKASQYYGMGRIRKGKFDWKYYEKRKHGHARTKPKGDA